jgi:hypothetical protein
MCRITGMTLAGLLLAALLVCSCGGILAETNYDNGQVERLRLDPGSKWSKWDRNSTKQDDSCLFLKSEKSF